MRPFRTAAALTIVAATLALPLSTAVGQSITPSSVSATMSVGESITINKTITLGPGGANLVDLFFLADNTGSMGGIINAAKAGASDVLTSLIATGGDFNFGVGRYLGDCSEAGLPAGCSGSYGYTQNAALSSSQAATQAGINAWFASGGGDGDEANFDALRMVATTAGWRTGSQRLIVWFGDYPSHTESTTEAGAIAALTAAGAKVIAFNYYGAGNGIDGCEVGTGECTQASDVVAATGGSLTNNFSGADFAAIVGAAITTETENLDLVFGTNFFDLYAGGLSFSFVCTDALGCMDVGPEESRTFSVTITALAAGTYDFSVFASGVSAEELDHIVVTDGVVPEPATVALLATGLLGLGAMAWRRKEEDEA